MAMPMRTGRPSFSPPSTSPALSFTAEPPSEFLCPIAGSLMADPVIIPSGETCERACIQACTVFSFTPLSLSSSLDLSHYTTSTPLLLIPNVNLKNAILNWCDHFGLPPPVPISADTARDIVRRMMSYSRQRNDVASRPRTPPQSVQYNRPTEYTSSSYYSSPPNHSRSSSSFPAVYTNEEPPKYQKNPAVVATAPPMRADSFEDYMLNGLADADPLDQEAVMVALRQATREPERRKSLCTPRLLSILRPMLLSDNPAIQITASAAMVNLSLEAENKVKIVRSGAVSPLVELLRGSHPEARDNAAGAIYSLALEDENRAAIGALGAIQPLLELFSDLSAEYRARREAGMALYYVSLGDTNRNKIARTSGAVRTLLGLAGMTDTTAPAEAATIRRLGMMVVANLAGCADGRAVLMDSGAVTVVAGLMRDGAAAAGTSEEEYCLSALHGMSRGSLRFRGLARSAGVEEVLGRVAGGEGGVRREMARRTLRAMRGEDDEAATAAAAAGVVFGSNYDDGNVVSEGLMSFKRRPKDYGSNSNSTKF